MTYFPHFKRANALKQIDYKDIVAARASGPAGQINQAIEENSDISKQETPGGRKDQVQAGTLSPHIE